jgi:hypothetical protein
MNKENYNILVKKIQEECPDLLELNFGCKVEHKNLIWKVIYKSITGDILLSHEYSREIITPQRIEFDKTIKNLGHSITLVEVLRTIDKKILKILPVGPRNLFIFLHTTELDETNAIEWDLSKNLEEQNDNIKNILYSIITKNESSI